MKTKMSAMFAAVLLMMAGSASAISTTSTLFDLVETGGSIGIGDKVFSDFGYVESDLIDFDASEIQVTAFIIGGVYYLSWDGDMTYASADLGFSSGDLLLTYTVTADPGRINMIDQYYTGSGQSQDGIVALAIDETVYNGVSVVAYSHLQLNDISDPFAEAGDDLHIDPAEHVLYVTKDINFTVFNRGQDGLGLVTLSQVRQSFHQVPDGGLTLAMLGFALTGLALVRRFVRN